MEEKTYSSKEFAEALGISKNHLLKLESEGKIPFAKRMLRGKIEHRYYTVQDLIIYRKNLGLPEVVQDRRVQLFLNFKGGTGKSTISSSYAYAVAELGVNVLAIDLDAQQHLTKCLGIDTPRNAKSIYDVIVEQYDINDTIIPTKLDTLDIIPGTLKLSVIENRLPNMEMREFLLKSALNNIQYKDYKVIVIDSLPNITILNKNAILAATDLLIPVLADYLSFDGLTLLMEELSRMEQTYRIYSLFPTGLLDNIHIFINQYKSNETMSRENRRALEEHYSQYLCETIIPYNTKITQATASGQPITQYAKNSPGAIQIRALVDEILQVNLRSNRKKRNYN
ncbi:MAG: AAA family ATPase [Planctomycetes bacterium]|nr:AAA family ATPase [Planctomycetota bacterium]HPY75611.1 AAA family ATPase [Planctomycetota bacterium]HQB01380.1 AAA family ATPase [Planctomycetota bacterium]HRU52310.1 AAA family ATPase [Planctomycetota bacterium]